MTTLVILRKGTVVHGVVMKTAVRRSPADRDRAVARLRAITIGTGIAGVAAVGGFGALAAASYDGGSTDVTTAAITTTATGGATSDASTSTSATTTTTTAQATAAPTATTGSAHAVTASS